MGEQDTVDVGEALESLVHQFADPWSFLRELIQNAIDAGSPEISVCVEHEPPSPGAAPDDPGLMLVEIIDTGGGMDREIIDTRLTRLFSSAKDGDYTKIGRFGIGFVSVFAIEPDLVCVDTGRTGEYWRVLFRKDRSFERIVLDTPVEGTTIRIYKRASIEQVEDARGRAREVLDYWCKHAKVELRCDDELVSRPFALDAHCVVEHEQDGTRVLIGYARAQQGVVRGYYHAGLTLHEERPERAEGLPFVSFKIDSRYLEHTLTRDNVIRDDNFAKAMTIVGELARGPLPLALAQELALRCKLGEEGDEVEFLRGRLVDLLSAKVELPAALYQLPLVPALDAHNQPSAVSLAEVRKRIARAYLTRAPSPVSAALARSGELVLCYRRTGWLARAVEIHAQGSPVPCATLCTATAPEELELEQASWAPLRAALLGLLVRTLGTTRGGEPVADIVLAHLAYPGSPVAQRVAITQGKFGELTKVEDIGELSSGWFASRRVVVVNADHPTVRHLLELAAFEPELAAYLLLKLFFLRSELSPERDAMLATCGAEARWRRSTT